MANLLNLALQSMSLKSCFVDSRDLIALGDEIDGFEPIDTKSIENCKKHILPKLNDPQNNCCSRLHWIDFRF